MSRAIVKVASVFLILLVASACRAAGQSAVAPADEPAQANVAPTNSQPAPVAGDPFDCSAVNEIPEAECRALVAFYEATAGDSWVENGGWLQSATPCSWHGVSCSEGHVEMLSLFFNGLGGQLPPALADLSQLRLLDLHNNGISGAIPEEVGHLVGLEALDLSANKLNGPLPATLGDLAILQSLVLARNALSGPIPDSLGRAAALRVLDLSHNQIDSQLPAALAHMQALEALRLNSNKLTGAIPFELGELPALTEIDLSFNKLTGTAPSALLQVAVHRLWGNALEGTVFGVQDAPQPLNYLGVSFTFDAQTADSVWAELEAAGMPVDGPGIPWASPEHVVFTLVHDNGPQDHAPLGLYLPAEAQIHIYPTAGLNAEAQAIAKRLQDVLDRQPDPAELQALKPEMESAQAAVGLLPPTNALQTLRAQVQYLTFGGGRGLRYLTQLSQGPTPINNQELFYTFQGLTDDGSAYVAAYFPVSLPQLPTSAQMDEGALATLMEDWQGYVSDTGQMLSQQPAAAFSPDLAALDAVISSLSVPSSQETAEVQGVWPEDGEAVDGQPVLQWVAFAGAEQYEVVVVDDDTYPPIAVLTEVTKEPMLALTTTLEPGSYSWTVRALDGAGATLAELNRVFTVKDAIALIAPANGETVIGAPLLQWEAYPGAARYQVVVLDDDAYPPVVVLDHTTLETKLGVSAPLEPGSYSWTVWALNSGDAIMAELTSQFVFEAQ